MSICGSDKHEKAARRRLTWLADNALLVRAVIVPSACGASCRAAVWRIHVVAVGVEAVAHHPGEVHSVVVVFHVNLLCSDGPLWAGFSSASGSASLRHQSADWIDEKNSLAFEDVVIRSSTIM